MGLMRTKCDGDSWPQWREPSSGQFNNHCWDAIPSDLKHTHKHKLHDKSTYDIHISIMGLGDKIKGTLQGDKDNSDYLAPERKAPGSYPSSDEMYRIYTRETRRDEPLASNPPGSSTRRPPRSDLPDYSFDQPARAKKASENTAKTASRDDAVKSNSIRDETAVSNTTDQKTKSPYWGDAKSSVHQKSVLKSADQAHDCPQCRAHGIATINGHDEGAHDMDTDGIGHHNGVPDSDMVHARKLGLIGTVSSTVVGGLDHGRKALSAATHKMVHHGQDSDITLRQHAAPDYDGSGYDYDSQPTEEQPGKTGTTQVVGIDTGHMPKDGLGRFHEAQPQAGGFLPRNALHIDNSDDADVPEYEASSEKLDKTKTRLAGVGAGIGTAVSYGASDVLDHNSEQPNNKKYKAYIPPRVIPHDTTSGTQHDVIHGPKPSKMRAAVYSLLDPYRNDHESGGVQTPDRKDTTGKDGTETNNHRLSSYEDRLQAVGLDRVPNHDHMHATPQSDAKAKNVADVSKPSVKKHPTSTGVLKNQNDLYDDNVPIKTSSTRPSGSTSILDPLRRRLGRESGHTFGQSKGETGSDSETEGRVVSHSLNLSGMGEGHYGPGHAGAKVLHRCEHCGKDNDISKYFRKEVIYRMS